MRATVSRAWHSAILLLVLTNLFWAVSILYQGMVVSLVQDVQDGRRDHLSRHKVARLTSKSWRNMGNAAAR